MNIEQQRAAFEAWHTREMWDGGYFSGHNKSAPDSYRKQQDGFYCDTKTQIAWRGWQAAIELDPQGRGEPVARAHITSTDTYPEIDLEVLNGAGLQPSMSPVDLYLAPQPADPVVKESLTTAEPVEVPSVDDALELIRHYADTRVLASRGRASQDEVNQLWVDVSALLARYGQPAQPAASAGPVGILECHASGDGTFWPDEKKVFMLPAGEYPLYTAPVAAQPSVTLPFGLRAVAQDLLACFSSWSPGVRVLGNVQAKDGADLMRAILATPPADEQADMGNPISLENQSVAANRQAQQENQS